MTQSSLNTATTSAYEKWRLLKDAIMRRAVVAGGLSVIFAIVVIFFYLLYVVYPIFLSASAESVAQYPIPEENAGKTLFLAIEEQNEIAARFTDKGQVVFFEAKTGKTLSQKNILLPEGVEIKSIAQGSPVGEGSIIYGLSNGQAVIVKHQYKVTFNGDKRVITPSLKYPLGETPLVIDDTGAALEKIAFKVGDGSTTIVAKTAEKIRITSFEKEQSLFGDEASLVRTDSFLDMPAGNITDILVDKEDRNLFLVSDDGSLSFIDISKKNAPEIKQHLNVVEAGRQV